MARRRGNTAEYAHHTLHLQGLLDQAHVDQRREARHVTDVEALVLGADAELAHRSAELDDGVERVFEHHLEDEVLAPRRVLGVVHRAHVQRGDVGAQLAQVGDPLLDRNADSSRRVVDDHVTDLFEDRARDGAEVLDLETRRAVGPAGVDVDHRRALVDRPTCFGGVLLRRVRDRRTLRAVRHDAGDRAGDDASVLEAAHVLPPPRSLWKALAATLKPALRRASCAVARPACPRPSRARG
ncbi:hypothetical protein HRbin41_01574 [bacterium HR41]|nr:hypothetical protein HRbin41_01574 [bacterium HR41]